MKARVKHNNEIIDVLQVGIKTHLFDLNNVEFLDNPQDYWTRLEHQYAGMAMQAIITNPIGFGDIKARNEDNDLEEIVADIARCYAHALVEKLKEERK